MALYGRPFQGRVENNAAPYDRAFMALYGRPFQGRVENNAVPYDRAFMALYGKPFQFQGRVENNVAPYDRAFMALYGRPFQGRVETNAALYDSERPTHWGKQPTSQPFSLRIRNCPAIVQHFNIRAAVWAYTQSHPGYHSEGRVVESSNWWQCKPSVSVCSRFEKLSR